MTEAIFPRVEAGFRTAPPGLNLRAADALHLATAAEAGCRRVYSNDRNLLAAAGHFDVEAVNLLDP